MTGTINYILARAGFRAMNGPLADERRRLAGAEPPAAYVSYDARLLAGVGWYGYRIAFKGGDRDMVRRALAMLAEYYIIRDGYEYYEGGVYVVGVLLRQRVPHYGIGGGAPTPEHDVLNFYMPNGGTVSLNKTGSPTVVELEYSIDGGATWTVWAEDESGNRSLTLMAGQRMYVRNTSNTNTLFSLGGSNDYYRFTFDETCYADGKLESLLCKNPDDAILTTYCFSRLFNICSTLHSIPILSEKTANMAYYNSFSFSGIKKAVIKVKIPASSQFYYAFRGSNIKEIRTDMTDISNNNCLYRWLFEVSNTGDFYCPAELTIPAGSSGIPSGWTRHDI